MFSLHENRRIQLCRAAFVLLCALPAAGVLIWCGVVHTPIYRRMHERVIAAQLGCKAQLISASSPRPDLVLYEGLDLTDRDSGQLLARFPAVEVHTGSDGTTVRLPMPGMANGRRLADFWQLALAQLRSSEDAAALRLEAGHLTLSLPSGDQTLTDIVGTLETDAQKSRLRFEFARATAGDCATAPMALTVTRGRADATKDLLAEFDTGGASLPCDVLATVWPAAHTFGHESTFAGSVRASGAAARWTLELAGRLEHVDLDRLMGQYPHKLTGQATIDLKDVTVLDGRIEKASGTIAAGPGTVSRSLLQSALACLRLESAPRALAGPENRFAYTQLGVEFDLGVDGLALRGQIPKQPRAILTAGDQVLVQQPTVEKQPVLNLVRTLVPQVALQVPATRETDSLTRWLPVPPVAVPPGQETALPEARSLRVSPTKR
jgi:hypothetical protein